MPKTRHKHHRAAFIILDILAACAIAGSWLLFAGNFSPHELALGAMCIVLALAIDVFAWRRMRVRFATTLQEVFSVWRLPWYVVADCWKVSRILIRQLSGKYAGSFFRTTPFHPTSGIEGISQIVLATAYTTISPNSIVVGFYNGQLLFHQLERSGVSRMVRDLEGNG